MKKAKLAASLIAVSMAATTLLTGCNNSNNSSDSNTPSGSNNSNDSNSSSPVEEGPKLEYKDGTELRMATGYNSPQTGIAFDATTAGEGVKLANGQTYHTGDLKPTWVELEKRLNVKFTDVYKGKKASDEFEYWKEQMDQVDMISGTATLLSEYGADGAIVDLNQYINSMPNFKKYLEENPIVRLSILGSTLGSNAGAIYFSPYFDGVNDIERMPLMRTDWVEKLLNGTEDFTATSSDKTATPSYQPYMPTSGKVEVDIVKADGSGTSKVTKDYDKAGNIIKLMNDRGSMTGVEAVNMLRKYIDEAYGGYYKPENRADLFIGQDAAWDADELVALLRCVVANSQTLNGGTAKIAGLFARNNDNMQRKVDLFRFAGTLFGVRGLESRKDYLYVGNDGELHDARMEAATYEAIERMNTLTKEGLISSDYISNAKTETKQLLQADSGFMHYDYSQTQTAFNENYLSYPDEMYRPVMVPVARWYDGTNKDGVYMRFTESWRSVKTDGWGISVKGVEGNPDKLNAALALIDYAYSPEGQILMSYGPDEFIKTKADGSYETFDFNGKQMPVIADATYTELWQDDRGAGSYTDYARKYLGSTLSFLKSQAFEYQCTHEAGRIGAGLISKAIGLGTIKHPELAIVKDNMWYTSVPTVLPTTKDENSTINGFTKLGKDGFGSSSGNTNIFVDIIIGGYSGEGTASRDATIKSVSEDWGGNTVLGIQKEAWGDLVKFYNK